MFSKYLLQIFHRVSAEYFRKSVNRSYLAKIRTKVCRHVFSTHVVGYNCRRDVVLQDAASRVSVQCAVVDAGTDAGTNDMTSTPSHQHVPHQSFSD